MRASFLVMIFSLASWATKYRCFCFLSFMISSSVLLVLRPNVRSDASFTLGHEITITAQKDHLFLRYYALLFAGRRGFRGRKQVINRDLLSLIPDPLLCMQI